LHQIALYGRRGAGLAQEPQGHCLRIFQGLDLRPSMSSALEQGLMLAGAVLRSVTGVSRLRPVQAISGWNNQSGSPGGRRINWAFAAI